jgi:NADPH:quinone reductase-like Zn-dependent oxidoreductase
MLQASQDRYGGSEVITLREVPKPVPKANEVLIRVHAASLTLADTAFRKADPFIVRFFGGLLAPRNLVHGSDFSGVIEAAVGAGVSRFGVGDAVYGATAGAHGEYISVAEDAAIVRKPETLSHVEAAGLSYSFLTAMPFLRDEAKLLRGQSILINGASGSIGIVAVQLARHLGAHVTGVCSGRNTAFVKSWGADRVIDYSSEDFAAETEAYDVIFDAVGKSSFAHAKPALKPHGIYLTTVPSLAILWVMLRTRKSPGKRGKLATTGLRPAAAKIPDLDLLNQLVADGAVRPVIDRTFPLSDIVDAHRYVDTERKRGDVVITI